MSRRTTPEAANGAVRSSAALRAFERFYYGPQAAVRPYLLARILPAMLAVDIWMLMIGHAGRYGAADFNVAHFAWLDAILPVPTPGAYIAVLALSGVLALFGALSRLSALGAGLLLVLYTLSWSMSMLDSYQHHYFLSLVLVCLAAFPRVDPEDLATSKGPRGEGDGTDDHAVPMSAGFGYPLLASTIAIVYAYTALAKCDALWTTGYTIRRISQVEDLVAPVLAKVTALGVSEASFWAFFATSVIPLEAAIAVGYAISSQRDRAPTRAHVAVAWATFLLGFMLHLGAEAMSLDIGWFSYYMLVLAAVYGLPARWLMGLAVLFVRPTLWLRARAQEVERDLAPRPWLAALVALGVGALAITAAMDVNLPGVGPAMWLVALVLVGFAGYALTEGEATRVVRPALVTAAACAVMWLTLTQSEVRWDFYRYLGGDLSRRGQLEAALDAYETGEAYAPQGKSRGEKIRKLRRQLGR